MDQQLSMQHMPIQYHGATPYQSGQILLPIGHGTFQQPPSSSYANATALSLSAHHNQLAYQQQHQDVQSSRANQVQGIDQAVDFRNHSLPLARIKKIMKSDENVRMISAEAPMVFAKACEMFINELTLRAWNQTEETKRRTLQKNDIATAITRTDIFDFLIDILPRDELKEDKVINLGTPKSSLTVASSSSNAGGANSFPYYYLPNQHPAPRGVLIVRKPMDPAIHMQNMLRQGHMHGD